MQIANRLAGFSLAEADVLRRAMGKKIQSLIDEQLGRFRDGALARGCPRPVVERLVTRSSAVAACLVTAWTACSRISRSRRATAGS